MSTFGSSDDETTDQLGALGQTVAAEPGHRPKLTSFDDDESTEVINNAEIGGFFGGRFRIDARLGSGAMGRVLTALDTESGRLVALKVLHRERSRDKNVLRRFAREAASLRAINHRAIVGIVASGRAPDGTPWLAMEHLTGITLKQRIAKHRMEPSEWWPVLKMLAEAVGEAHARGVVHRDLKPENIFLPEGGDPPCKILDFGLSTLNREGADKVTATGQLLGTPRYMAPELLASIGKPDHRVDVFALAVVTFEALTGRSLYSADDLGSLFGQILEARTHSLRQFRPDLSMELESVIKQGHARSMGDRFQTAGAFATAFARAAGIGDAIAPPPALAALFDDVNDGDGNAPLVDPFGAPARATGNNPAHPLPPLAADVPPLVPPRPTSSRPGRSRVGTHLGVGPDGSTGAHVAAALPSIPPAAVPRPFTPAEPPSRAAVGGAVVVGASPGYDAQPQGFAAPAPQAPGHEAPPGFGAPAPGYAVPPQGFGAPPPQQGFGAPPQQGFGAPPQQQGFGGPTPGQVAAWGAPPPAGPSGTGSQPTHDPRNVPTMFATGDASSMLAAQPSLGAAAQPGSARGFTPPVAPRFSMPSGAITGNAAVAPAAAPAAAPAPARSNALGCFLFAVAAVVVVAVAVAGALALRYYLARGGF